MTVQPHEPIGGIWLFSDEDMKIDGHWPIGKECDWFDKTSPAPLLVTLANGQRVIVRALSEERKAARLLRLAHKLGVMKSQEEMDQMSRDFEYAKANAESGVFR